MDKRLMDLRSLVRSRFQRDLRAVATISEQQSELSLDELLDELHNTYVHYVQLNALLNNAGSVAQRSNSKLQEALNRLRSAD